MAKGKKRQAKREMFGQDPTGILRGYYERMHQTVRAMIEHMMVDPTAQLDPADMSLVWRGWVRQSAMEAIFGDVYDFEARPSAENAYDFGDKKWCAGVSPGDYRYGTWRRDFIIGLEFGEPLDRDGVIELFKMGKRLIADERWGVVTEAMLMLVEGSGEVRVSMRIRGWRAVPRKD